MYPNKLVDLHFHIAYVVLVVLFRLKKKEKNILVEHLLNIQIENDDKSWGCNSKPKSQHLALKLLTCVNTQMDNMMIWSPGVSESLQHLC